MNNYTNQTPYSYQNVQGQNQQYYQSGGQYPPPNYSRPYPAYQPYPLYPQRAPEDPKKILRRQLTRVGIAVLAAVGAMYVFVYAFTIIYTVFNIFGSAAFSEKIYAIITELISCIGAYVIAPIVMWLILRKLPYKEPQKGRATPGEFIKWIFIAIGLDISISLISSLVMSVYSSIFGGDSYSLLESTTDVPFYITLLSTVIIAPIVEEIMFRQILLKRLLPMGEMFAIALSAIIFGLFHMNYYQFFYAAALGLLFAAIVVKTGNILYTMALHMIINFLGSVETMWLEDYPVIDAFYTYFLIVLMLVGIVIFVIDVIKKDGTVQAVPYYKRSGSAAQAVKSPGLITCIAVMGGFSLIMTVIMAFMY